ETRSVSCPAGVRALHFAGDHLECTEQLDHRATRLGKRGAEHAMAADAALLLGIPRPAGAVAESGFLRRCSVGNGSDLDSLAQKSAGTLFLLYGRSGFSRALDLLAPLSCLCQLGRPGAGADVLFDGPPLGRALACRVARAQGLADWRIGVGLCRRRPD